MSPSIWQNEILVPPPNSSAHGDLPGTLPSRARAAHHQSTAEAATAIPGLELVEMKESSLCCGSAGIYNIIRPEMANELGDQRPCVLYGDACD